MVILVTVLPALNYNRFAALNLQDAYFHVAIFPGHRKYLRFLITSYHYQYTVLPFRLPSAPYVFIKYMTVMAAFLRSRGIYIFPYLNDWLLRGPSREQVLYHVRFTLDFFYQFGLI